MAEFSLFISEGGNSGRQSHSPALHVPSLRVPPVLGVLGQQTRLPARGLGNRAQGGEAHFVKKRFLVTAVVFCTPVLCAWHWGSLSTKVTLEQKPGAARPTEEVREECSSQRTSGRPPSTGRTLLPRSHRTGLEEVASDSRVTKPKTAFPAFSFGWLLCLCH